MPPANSRRVATLCAHSMLQFSSHTARRRVRHCDGCGGRVSLFSNSGEKQNDGSTNHVFHYLTQ
jgi:hypothetical protein